MYKSIFYSNGNRSNVNGNSYGVEITKLLESLPESAEIVAVQHTQAGNYGGYWSTLIIYRDYQDDNFR